MKDERSATATTPLVRAWRCAGCGVEKREKPAARGYDYEYMRSEWYCKSCDEMSIKTF